MWAALLIVIDFFANEKIPIFALIIKIRGNETTFLAYPGVESCFGILR